MKFLFAVLFTSVALAAPAFQNINNWHLARRGQQTGHGDRGGDANSANNNVGVNSGQDSILAGTGNSLAVTTENVLGNAGDRLQRRGLVNALGIAGNANSNEDSSENHNVSAGNNQQFSGDGNSNTATATLAGQSVDQSIHG